MVGWSIIILVLWIKSLTVSPKKRWIGQRMMQSVDWNWCSQGCSEKVSIFTVFSWNKAFLKWWKSRKADRFLPYEVTSFLKDMSLQLGAQLFIMAAYEKPDGTIYTTKYAFHKWKILIPTICQWFYLDIKVSHTMEISLATNLMQICTNHQHRFILF